jgi:hypothetical protein
MKYECKNLRISTISKIDDKTNLQFWNYDKMDEKEKDFFIKYQVAFSEKCDLYINVSENNEYAYWKLYAYNIQKPLFDEITTILGRKELYTEFEWCNNLYTGFAKINVLEQSDTNKNYYYIRLYGSGNISLKPLIKYNSELIDTLDKLGINIHKSTKN